MEVRMSVIGAVMMPIEHVDVAFKVRDAKRLGDFLQGQLGWIVVSQTKNTQFLWTGSIHLELKSRWYAPLWRRMVAEDFHIGVVVDAAADELAAKMIESGAKRIGKDIRDGGTVLIMLDVFGLKIQLCQRARPLSKLAINS